MCFHPAYGYFTDAYGLTQVAIEENGAAPGPRHLAEVIDRAREQGTKTVFVQPQVSASYAETVAKAIGAEVVTLDPLAEDYIEEPPIDGPRDRLRARWTRNPMKPDRPAASVEQDI